MLSAAVFRGWDSAVKYFYSNLDNMEKNSFMDFWFLGWFPLTCFRFFANPDFQSEVSIRLYFYENNDCFFSLRYIYKGLFFSLPKGRVIIIFLRFRLGINLDICTEKPRKKFWLWTRIEAWRVASHDWESSALTTRLRPTTIINILKI